MILRFHLLMASAAGLGACTGPAVASGRPESASGRLIAAQLLQLPSVPVLQLARPAEASDAGARTGSAREDRPGEAPTDESARLARGEAGAVRVYAWQQGSAYRLDTAPERVSDIALETGESLIAVAAGDTVRWVIGDTTSGSGASRRTHILVKPAAPGLRTNLVITTDRRVYHVDLASSARTAVRSISWSYPQDDLLVVRKAGADVAGEPSAAVLGVEALNFNYSIDADRPSWRPLRAFDDGRQVFIQFPANFGTGDAPPLFVVGPAGGAELVNYRAKGRYYVVDRLFSVAELRLGEKRQQIVRITRADPRPLRRRRTS